MILMIDLNITKTLPIHTEKVPSQITSNKIKFNNDLLNYLGS